MNKINWLRTFNQLSPITRIEIVLVIFMIFVVIPVVAYVDTKRRRIRKKISERGINALAGKCSICGGKLKIVNLFPGRANYYAPFKIGAARCTLCKHLEIFSEEP